MSFAIITELTELLTESDPINQHIHVSVCLCLPSQKKVGVDTDLY